jgi:4-alpha-glucanotransferase
MAESGQRLVQVLPLGPLPDGESSPYSAATSFGIDPMYLAIDRLEDVRAEDLTALVGPDADERLAHLRSTPTIDYGLVRTIKRRVLRAAFERFYVHEFERKSERARRLERFVETQRAWLPDFALFRVLKARYGGSWWKAWPTRVRDREPAAIAEASNELGRAALAQMYAQWIAHEQWTDARKEVRETAHGMELMGDLPFMIGVDSADVWQRRGDFLPDATLGAPGDAFAPDGQDWGLPAYDWAAMDANDLAFVRTRAGAMGALFDRFRIDHLIGYYRMYVRPKGATPRFSPSEEPAQIARGERVLTALVDAAKANGAKVIAEDLGVVPTWARQSLVRLGLPGYKVLMWEKDGETFRDPAAYPYLSLASTGTHDTETLAVWWTAMRAAERARAIVDIPALQSLAHTAHVETLSPPVHRALLAAIYGAGSELALLPFQDLLGLRDRINTPGTVGAHNWSWRLPDTIEAMRVDPLVKAKLHDVGKAVTAGHRAR